MEQKIQAVIVMIKSLKVTAFSAAESGISVRVRLNDGRDKELNWKSRITDPRLMTVRLLNELMALEEGEYAEFDGETLTNTATAILYNKEKTEAAMTDFFQTLYSKAKRIKNTKSSDGYLNMVADLRRTELNF